eukprot:11022402-Alexandrium_andersonii.AAC.1
MRRAPCLNDKPTDQPTAPKRCRALEVPKMLKEVEKRVERSEDDGCSGPSALEREEKNTQAKNLLMDIGMGAMAEQLEAGDPGGPKTFQP